MNRCGWQKISKGIADLNSTIKQLYTTDIYRVLHPTTAEYTSQVHLGHYPKETTFWATKHIWKKKIKNTNQKLNFAMKLN
jgi:hypothetical protein